MRTVIVLTMASIVAFCAGRVHGIQPVVAITPGVELAPPPRAWVPTIRLLPAPGGFQIALSRPMAEVLRDTLDTAADEKQIAKLLRENARKLREEPGDGNDVSAAKLELIAFVVSSQLPTFKQALHERMGTNGVVIQAVGLQRKTVFRKPRPKLERALEIAGRIVGELTPEEVGQTLEAAKAMAKTTPLGWTVLPQE